MYPASYFRRVCAYIIDGLIFGVALNIVFAMTNIGMSTFGSGAISQWMLPAILLQIVAAVALYMGYLAATMLRTGERHGQTVGKQALGIRVVREDGHPLTMKTVIKREAPKYFLFKSPLSIFLFIPFLLNALWPLKDERGRALHDLVGETVVVGAHVTEQPLALPAPTSTTVHDITHPQTAETDSADRILDFQDVVEAQQHVAVNVKPSSHDNVY